MKKKHIPFPQYVLLIFRSPLLSLLSLSLLTLTLKCIAPVFEIKVKTCSFEAAYVYVFPFCISQDYNIKRTTRPTVAYCLCFSLIKCCVSAYEVVRSV